MPAKSPAMSPQARAMLNSVGEQLRARRKALGIQVSVAATTAGISRVTWYRIEKGEPSVAAAAYAGAASVLGVDLALSVQGQRLILGGGETQGMLPVQVRLADYPQLRQLAWQVHGRDVLSLREASSIYERNARHLDEKALTPSERSLIQSLRIAFSADGTHV